MTVAGPESFGRGAWITCAIKPKEAIRGNYTMVLVDTLMLFWDESDS